MSEIIKKSILAGMPKGALHVIAPGEDEDRLYDGMAESLDDLLVFLSSLADTRNPYKTPFLDTLEKEYGILPNPTLTDDERRAALAALVYAPRGNGSKDNMQDQLHLAGFTDLFVYDNSPAVDSGTFIGTTMTCFSADPIEHFSADPIECFAAQVGSGEYVVNGDIYDQNLVFTEGSSDPITVFSADPIEFFSGAQTLLKDPITYTPTENFNLIFFVGGAVVRDPVTDKIISIEHVDVPANKRELLRRIILRAKPIHTWGALAVNFVEAAGVYKDTIGVPDVYKDAIGDPDVYKDEIGA